MMGNGGVGKSSIALKFVRGQFVDRYDPTIEVCRGFKMLNFNEHVQQDSFQFQFPVDDHVIMFDILDTAGQEDMKCLRRQWSKDIEIHTHHLICRIVEGRDCYMLVFALNDRTSFDEALSLQDLVADVKDGAKKLPIVYVGNKSDLPKVLDSNIHFLTIT